MKRINAFTLAEGATHVANSNNARQSGFTLAEVLITLGIIGVVAAMTMPTLMNQTNGAQYKAAYKKALSAISQAVTLNVALDDYNFADLSKTDVTLRNMLTNRMNVVREENAAIADYTITKANYGGTTGDGKAPATSANNTTLFFNDGIMFTFPKATSTTKGCTEAEKCYGFIDVNGTKAPNKEVSCDEAVSASKPCAIKSPTDVYPVVFYDQTILPSTEAGKAVLYGK